MCIPAPSYGRSPVGARPCVRASVHVRTHVRPYACAAAGRPSPRPPPPPQPNPPVRPRRLITSFLVRSRLFSSGHVPSSPVTSLLVRSRLLSSGHVPFSSGRASVVPPPDRAFLPRPDAGGGAAPAGPRAATRPPGFNGGATVNVRTQETAGTSTASTLTVAATTTRTPGFDGGGGGRLRRGAAGRSRRRGGGSE